MVELLIDAELERNLKEAAVAYSKFQSCNSPINTDETNEKLRENSW